MNNARELENQLSRMEELLAGVDDIQDENAREQTRELVKALLELHRVALHRALEISFESAEGGAALIDKLAADALVSPLLLLHGLHPVDLETRVRGALEAVKPRLGLHGGAVELIGITPEGAVRLQLAGNCEGCPSSRVTLRYSIEEALYAAAPDITALEVNGLVEEQATTPANPKWTECPSTNGNGQHPTGANP